MQVALIIPVNTRGWKCSWVCFVIARHVFNTICKKLIPTSVKSTEIFFKNDEIKIKLFII